MKLFVVLFFFLIPVHLSFAEKIDLGKWKEVPTNKHTCPEGSIYYEETPAFGLRTILCHSLSVWPISVLEELSGEKVFISGPHKAGKLNLQSITEFGHYNPAFIEWSIHNLIPDYQNKDTQYIWRGMYEGYLKPVFQAAMKSYYDLKVNETYRQEEVNRYNSERVDQRGRYRYRWGKIKGNIHAAGPQMYAFWIRRYIDGSAIKIGSQLEKFLKVYDLDFLNQARAEFGLANLESQVKTQTLGDSELAADFKKLETFESSEEKIKFLESIRYNYSKPEHVSKVLIAIGDLKPKSLGRSAFKQEEINILGVVNGYSYNEISGDMLYTGAEYREVIKLFPGTEYAADAAYKMLSLYQGGECEGEVGCYLNAASARQVQYIKVYPDSRHVSTLILYLDKVFSKYIQQIRMLETEEDYSQTDLQNTLKQTLQILQEATENTSPETKAFSGYYNGLFYLKTNDLPSARSYFEETVNLQGVEDNKFVGLAKAALLSFPSDKITLLAPQVFPGRNFRLTWQLADDVIPTEVDIYQKVEGGEFQLIQTITEGNTYQFPIQQPEVETKFKIALKLLNTEKQEWSNIVSIRYEPKVHVKDAYINGDYLYLLTYINEWSEILTVHLENKKINTLSAGFVGGEYCNKNKLANYPQLVVLDKERRDFRLLSQVNDYQVVLYNGTTEYNLDDLKNCVKYETQKYSLSTKIDEPNKIIWLHPFNAYVRKPKMETAWTSFNNRIVQRSMYSYVFLIKDETYYYDQVSLLDTPDYVVSHTQKGGKIYLYDEQGEKKTILAKVYNSNSNYSPFQYSEKLNTLFWFNAHNSIARLDLDSKIITTTKISKPVMRFNGTLHVVYNDKTDNYWIIGGKTQNFEKNGRKYRRNVISLFEYDQSGQYVKDTPVRDMLFGK